MESKNPKTNQLLCLLGLLACLSTGCSNTVTASGSESGGTISNYDSGNGDLSLPSTSVALYVEGSYTFSATGGVPPYRYFMVSGEGSINENSGVYTAPRVAGTAIVVVEDSTGTDEYANVTIQGLDLNLTISPAEVSVREGGSATFTASGGTSPYTYSISSGIGSINSKTGVYTAPSSTGDATILVTDAMGEEVSASVTVMSSSTGDIPPAPLYREFDATTGFHMSTLTSGEGSPAYAVQEVLLNVYGDQSSSTIVPLYRCSVGGDIHFSTTSATCEGVTGAELELQMGWLDSVQGSGEIPLYRLHSSSTGDCLDSLSSSEGTQNGYVLDGILGYGLSAN